MGDVRRGSTCAPRETCERECCTGQVGKLAVLGPVHEARRHCTGQLSRVVTALTFWRRTKNGESRFRSQHEPMRDVSPTPSASSSVHGCDFMEVRPPQAAALIRQEPASFRPASPAPSSVPYLRREYYGGRGKMLGEEEVQVGLVSGHPLWGTYVYSCASVLTRDCRTYPLPRCDCNGTVPRNPFRHDATIERSERQGQERARAGRWWRSPGSRSGPRGRGTGAWSDEIWKALSRDCRS